jgi:hypothetical protein
MLSKKFLPLIIGISAILISCGDEKRIVEVRYGPVLFDLVSPDSLERGSGGLSYIFVSAFDPDGQNDIDSVYFVSIRPDGSSNGTHFYMHDDGQHGDSIATDGRFSVGIQPPDTSSQIGDYTFTFYARDKEGNPSNHPQASVTVY